MDSDNPSKTSQSQRLIELATLFLRLGFTAFGGPAAHIAMMRQEVVGKRKWMTDQEFLDTLGATNLIPGPNSTEMTIHIGALRAGWPGLLVAGACFIVPAMLIVLVLSWAYVTYGTTPAAGWLLYGVKPVIIAIVAQAIWTLGRAAVKGWLTGVIGLAALAGFFLGIETTVILFGGALIVMLIENVGRLRKQDAAGLLVGARGVSPLRIASTMLPILAAEPFSLGVLFLTFLKIGAVLYGGGYTLLAFVQHDFVERLGWLNQQQLIDAVAIGQMTPGPLFTTATFIGYLMGSKASGGAVLPGIGAGLIATLGIFLPSFIFVAISHPFIPKMRQSKWAGAFLDGVNAAAVGLMAAITIELARAAFIDPITIALGLIAAVLLIRFNVNSLWLVLGGGLIGAVVGFIR